MPTFLLCSMFTVVSACVSLGFSVEAALTSRERERTAFLYTLVRSVALVSVSLVGVIVPSHAWLEAATLGMILVQTGDGLVGLRTRSLLKIVGPFVTAALNMAALVLLLKA